MSENELTEEDVIRYLEECNESQDILGFCYIPEMVCSKILDLYQKEKKLKDKIRELIDKRGNNGYTSLDCIEDILKLLEERN